MYNDSVVPLFKGKMSEIDTNNAICKNMNTMYGKHAFLAHTI